MLVHQKLLPGTYNLPNIEQETLTAQGGGGGGNIPFNQLTTQQKLRYTIW